VWWVDFDPTKGNEQAGQRPAVIVSSLQSCRIRNGVVTVVPCTTKDHGLSFHPLIHLEPARMSYAMCEQLKTISVVRLMRRINTALPANDISAIKSSIRLMIDVSLN